MRYQHHQALPAGYRLHWYEVERVLGQGGFGITYLALDTNLDQQVAIKEFLPTELATRTRDSTVSPLSGERAETFRWGLARFLSEARTLARFRHPNIVRVYSVFEANNTAYMVMEYEHGVELSRALREGRVQGEADLLGVMLPILDGLQQVHEAGFIHRDIKPDNIFLRDDGLPVLIDFGSARQALGSETRTLTALVSPGYAPFEQYNPGTDAAKQGPWTDIYALGAVMYRCIFGRGPGDALTRVNALVGGQPDPLVPATQCGQEKGYSPELLTAVDAALAFHIEARPQSIAEWREQLTAEVEPRDGLETVQRDAPTVIGTQGELPTTRLVDQEAPTVRPEAAGPRTVPADTPPIEPTVVQTTRKRPWPAFAALAGVIVVGAGLWATAGEWVRGAPRPSPAVEAGNHNPVKTTATAAVPDVGESEVAVTSSADATTAARAPATQRSPHTKGETHVAEGRPKQVNALEPTKAPEDGETTEQTETIEALLAAAEADIAALRLTRPTGNNALERLRAVLRSVPDEPRALAGIERVVDRYLELADRATRGQRFQKAEGLLDTAAGIGAGAERVTAARARTELAKAAWEAEQTAAATLQREEQARASEAAKVASTVAAGDTAMRERVANLEAQLQQLRSAQTTPAAPAKPRVGVFPFAFHSEHGVPERFEKKLSGMTERVVLAHRGLDLAYNYYSGERGNVPEAEDLWSGMAAKKPKLERIVPLATDLKLDGVLLYFAELTRGSRGKPVPVDAYLVDVARGDIVHRRGTTRGGMGEPTEALLDELVLRTTSRNDGNARVLSEVGRATERPGRQAPRPHL